MALHHIYQREFGVVLVLIEETGSVLESILSLCLVIETAISGGRAASAKIELESR